MRQPDTSNASAHDGTKTPAAPAPAPANRARVRRWAYAGMVAQVAFVASWLVAASWQGPRYSVAAHAVSDMYAIGAPHAAFLIVVTTCCGAAVLMFGVRSLLPSLRAGGRPATIGTVLFCLSPLGLGDLLTPFEREACRQADPGCSLADQLSNAGGRLDGNLTSVGIVLLVVAAFFLAAAMKRLPAWRSWAWPTRWTAVVLVALMVATAVTGPAGLDGLFERLLAAVGATGALVLAAGIVRRS